jgi:molybdopterin-guanine dinucleotide biosynthesis protein A
MLGLILVGGQSERMGQPKALLQYRGRPLYLHAYELLKTVCTEVYISSRREQDFEFDIPVIYDDKYSSIGPAAGLLSAHEIFRDTLFVVACDYPLATKETVLQLFEAYQPPATYFLVNGQIEPLFGIWGPEALDQLKKNVDKGNTGPIYTLKSLGYGIELKEKSWLYNTNTPEEWRTLQDISDITGSETGGKSHHGKH